MSITEDQIVELGIDGDERLFLRPRAGTFSHIYRAAMQVEWDPVRLVLQSPKPREWSYLDWFRQIIAAAASEYSVRLKSTPATIWTNVPEVLRAEIEHEQTTFD